MNSDLKEIKRELSFGINQFDPKAKYSITNPAQVKHNLNFINHSLFRDVFTPLNNDTQIFISQARTDWKKDIVGHHFQEKLIQASIINRDSYYDSNYQNHIVTSVQKIFAQFDADEEYSLIIYDTPNCDQMNEDIIQWMDEIIEQNSDNKTPKILANHSHEKQSIDPSKLVDFLKQQVTNPINQEKLHGYFSKLQISEDELRKCQISFQKQFDQQLDQVIGILLENFEKIEAQAIVEQEIKKSITFSWVSNQVRVGLRLVDDLLKARKRKGYGSCTII